ncbi:MAG: malate dehydrogenase [Nitrososphaerota archaeon]|nr:malate dehydrogenase [Nitrososphaerota archaeon]
MRTHQKVSIIGAGQVGGTTAEHVAIKELADVVLFDVVPNVAEGKALDIQEGAPHWGFDVSVEGRTVGKEGKEFSDLEGSDIVVITSGLARKPGMSRDDLLFTNLDIVKGVAEKVKLYAPESMIIVVTNPMDIMAYTAYRATGFKEGRVMGMGGTLDSTRFATFVAKELGVSVEDVEAFVIGGHGDDMVPSIRYCSVGGLPIEKLMAKERIEDIVKRTRNGGGEIVNLLKTGSAFYAPGIAITTMVESILKDKKRVIPVAALLSGEVGEYYGVKNFFMGVPVKLASSGIEQVFKVEFNEEERALWNKSVESTRASVIKADSRLGSGLEH